MTSASGVRTQAFVESQELAKTNLRSKTCADDGHTKMNLLYDATEYGELSARESRLGHQKANANFERYQEAVYGAYCFSQG